MTLSPDDFKGIYVTPPFNKGDPADNLAESYFQAEEMDGVALRVQWASLEPAQDNFVWSNIEPDIDFAVQYGKKISIGMLGASNSPDWVKSASAPLDFSVMGPRDIVKTVTLPTPWNPFYVNRYLNLWTELQLWLLNKGALDLVRIVKIAPLSEDTLECRLPKQENTPINNILVWLGAGYHPGKVLDAHYNVLTGVSALFTGTVIAQAIMGGNLFPRIDESGVLIAKRYVTTQNDMVARSVARYPGRFAVVNSALRNGGKELVDPLWSSYVAAGAIGGWQTNLFEGFNGAGCQADRSSPTQPCTGPLYANMLSDGIEQGGKWIEVWPVDFDEFRTEIAAVRPAFWPLTE